MNDTAFYKRPWFYIAAWLVFLLVMYFWQVFRIGDIAVNQVRIFVDLACIFPILLLFWMAFFSQFVLPVRTLEDRQKIFSRLISRLFGSSGAAIFVENGKIREHSEESSKKGAGVLWLDSASAAVTRTAVKIKQVLGPGVHFIEGREYIAGTVDLHIQSQSIGPLEKDKPFDARDESLTDDQYYQLQDRRKQVSALTRDGIEVVPNISVSFRVDTGFPQEGQPGSRFGYRTGITPKDKQDEREDQLAILKAVLGEGINPNVGPESPSHRVAWNQLPALLAIDVWREYVSKFTLDELFTPCREIAPSPPPPPLPTEEEVDELSQPLQVGANRDALQHAIARMLRQINLFMAGTTSRLERKNGTKPQATPVAQPPPASEKKAVLNMKTGFQIINDMVRARLTQPSVDFLDDTGQPDEKHEPVFSPEFQLLNNRGLRILSAGVSNPRFNPVIDTEMIDQWVADWLANAIIEREQIERRRSLIQTLGQENALRQYADVLSQAVLKEKPTDIKSALKTLLMKSRAIIIRNDQLRRKMSNEQQELEDILRWIEANGS